MKTLRWDPMTGPLDLIDMQDLDPECFSPRERLVFNVKRAAHMSALSMPVAQAIQEICLWHRRLAVVMGRSGKPEASPRLLRIMIRNGISVDDFCASRVVGDSRRLRFGENDVMEDLDYMWKKDFWDISFFSPSRIYYEIIQGCGFFPGLNRCVEMATGIEDPAPFVRYRSTHRPPYAVKTDTEYRAFMRGPHDTDFRVPAILTPLDLDRLLDHPEGWRYLTYRMSTDSKGYHIDLEHVASGKVVRTERVTGKRSRFLRAKRREHVGERWASEKERVREERASLIRQGWRIVIVRGMRKLIPPKGWQAEQG